MGDDLGVSHFRSSGGRQGDGGSAVVVVRGAGRTHEVCPCAVEAPGLDEGAEGEYGLSTGDAPSHAGALQSLCDEGLAGGFDPRFREGRLGADGEAPVPSCLGIACACGVFGRRRVRARFRRGSFLPCRGGSAAPGSPWRRLGDRDAGHGGMSRTSGGLPHGRRLSGDARRRARSRRPRPLARGFEGRSSCLRRRQRWRRWRTRGAVCGSARPRLRVAPSA